MDVAERAFLTSKEQEMTIPAGEASGCFALKLRNWGWVKRLIVCQASGTETAFSVNLYNFNVCDAQDSEGSSESGAACCTASSMWKIIPTQRQATPGANMELFVAEQGYAFKNQDGAVARPVPRVYLEIILDAAVGDDTTWEAVLAINTADNK